MNQTTGTTFSLYVYPDLVYSPGYVEAANAPLGANSEWRWTYAGLTGAPLTTVWAAQNNVDFTVTPVGVYAVTVEERNTLIGCAGGVITQNINVVAAPTGGFTTADATAYCGNQAAQAINIRFIENVPNALTAYGFAVSELVEEIDGSDAWIATVSTNNTFVDFQLTAKAKSGTPGVTLATPNLDYDFNSSALAVSNNNRTRYTYTLLEASDAGTGIDGIISAISQKSGYTDGLVTYAFTDDAVVFIVNPAPVTGPIYHIANDYSY